MAPYVEPCICGLFNFLTINEKHPAPIPLQGVSVSVKVVDFVAEVTIEQQYKNKEEKPIEAIYIFPLDHDSAVHTFEADIDGRQLVGVVKEKEEAKKEYEEALERGDTAVMLQQVKREIFKARIGNIPPGKNASVKIAYYTELLPDESAVRFYLPTTIAPRYRPASDTSEAAKEISSITYTDFTPAPLKVEVKFEMKSKIIRMESPTHQIKTTIEATENAHKMFGATATLAAETTDMDKDFVVLISTENPHVPRICLETNSEHDTTAAVLTVVPKFELHDQKVELIFVIDRSGSMHGESIAKAKEALKLFLHSLPVDCYVNIVGFGSSYEVLFKNGSKKYDDVVLKECSMHASSLDAELGGTEILEPLREVLDWKPIEGYLRQVFVLTDGEVSNTDQVIQHVRQNAHKTRVFSLGIGDCASHELVEGISRAGNGTSEFVSYNENLKSKVIKQLKHALQPALSKVSVKWGDLEAESSVVEINKVKTLLGYGTPKKVPPKTTLMQAPYIIPPVFNGTRTLVYCIFEKANVPKQVILTAESPDGPLSVTLEVKDEEIYEGKILHRLAARKLIRDLEDGVSWLGSSATDEVKKEVIRLGCKYGVASSYTSFIAVDKSTNAGAGKEFEIVAREVPSQMAFGWGGGFTSVAFSCPSPMRMGMPMALCAPMPAQLKMGGFNKSSSQVKVKRRCKSNYVSREAFSQDDISDEAVSQEESAESDPLAALIELQQFDGQFRADTSMPSLISSSENAIIEGATDNKVSKEVWATAIAIAFMEEKYPDRKDEWELVAEKAIKWLKKNVAGDVEDLIQKAKVFVKKCLG